MPFFATATGASCGEVQFIFKSTLRMDKTGKATDCGNTDPLVVQVRNKLPRQQRPDATECIRLYRQHNATSAGRVIA